MRTVLTIIIQALLIVFVSAVTFMPFILGLIFDHAILGTIVNFGWVYILAKFKAPPGGLVERPHAGAMFKTTDTGELSPYPNMTADDLKHFEQTFKVPKS